MTRALYTPDSFPTYRGSDKAGELVDVHAGCGIYLYPDYDADHPVDDGDYWKLAIVRAGDPFPGYGSGEYDDDSARVAAERRGAAGVAVYGDPRRAGDPMRPQRGPYWHDENDGPGWCYVTPEWLDEWGCDTDPDAVRANIEAMLANAATWADGGVVGYVVVNAANDVVGSCWGYYPDEPRAYGDPARMYACAIGDARGEAEWWAQAQDAELDRWATLCAGVAS